MRLFSSQTAALVGLAFALTAAQAQTVTLTPYLSTLDNNGVGVQVPGAAPGVEFAKFETNQQFPRVSIENGLVLFRGEFNDPVNGETEGLFTVDESGTVTKIVFDTDTRPDGEVGYIDLGMPLIRDGIVTWFSNFLLDTGNALYSAPADGSGPVTAPVLAGAVLNDGTLIDDIAADARDGILFGSNSSDDVYLINMLTRTEALPGTDPNALFGIREGRVAFSKVESDRLFVDFGDGNAPIDAVGSGDDLPVTDTTIELIREIAFAPDVVAIVGRVDVGSSTNIDAAVLWERATGAITEIAVQGVTTLPDGDLTGGINAIAVSVINGSPVVVFIEGSGANAVAWAWVEGELIRLIGGGDQIESITNGGEVATVNRVGFRPLDGAFVGNELVLSLGIDTLEQAIVVLTFDDIGVDPCTTEPGGPVITVDEVLHPDNAISVPGTNGSIFFGFNGGETTVENGVVFFEGTYNRLFPAGQVRGVYTVDRDGVINAIATESSQQPDGTNGYDGFGNMLIRDNTLTWTEELTSIADSGPIFAADPQGTLVTEVYAPGDTLLDGTVLPAINSYIRDGERLLIKDGFFGSSGDEAVNIVSQTGGAFDFGNSGDLLLRGGRTLISGAGGGRDYEVDFNDGDGFVPLLDRDVSLPGLSGDLDTVDSFSLDGDSVVWALSIVDDMTGNNEDLVLLYDHRTQAYSSAADTLTPFPDGRTPSGLSDVRVSTVDRLPVIAFIARFGTQREVWASVGGELYRLLGVGDVVNGRTITSVDLDAQECFYKGELVIEATTERPDPLEDAEAIYVATFDNVGPLCCQGDPNGDGVSDFFDVIFGLRLIDAEDPAGDFNGDGVIDSEDVLRIVTDVEAGCP